MFIIQLTYKKPLAEVDQFLEEHRQFLKKYYDNGTFLLSGRKNPRTGGIILAQAERMTEVEQLVTEDPFHQHGLAEYSITEFIPTMAAASLQSFIQ